MSNFDDWDIIQAALDRGDPEPPREFVGPVPSYFPGAGTPEALERWLAARHRAWKDKLNITGKLEPVEWDTTSPSDGLVYKAHWNPGGRGYPMMPERMLNRHETRYPGMKPGGLAEMALNAVDPNIEDNAIFVVKTNLSRKWLAKYQYVDKEGNKKWKKFERKMQAPYIAKEEYYVFHEALRHRGPDFRVKSIFTRTNSEIAVFYSLQNAQEALNIVSIKEKIPLHGFGGKAVFAILPRKARNDLL